MVYSSNFVVVFFLIADIRRKRMSAVTLRYDLPKNYFYYSFDEHLHEGFIKDDIEHQTEIHFGIIDLHNSSK